MNGILQNKKLMNVLISAVLALAFVNFYLRGRETNIENSFGMVDVLSAGRDIPPHTAINASWVTTKRVPQRYVEPGAILVKLPGDGISKIKDKITAIAMPEGTQITQSILQDPSSKETGVAPLIPPGKRAYILRLTNLDVGKLLLPGDHVDVLATFTVRQGENTSKATKTILQNVLVIAVDKDIRKQNEDVSKKDATTEALTITLALEPIEAEAITLALEESQGSIAVVIRSHGDVDIRQVPVLTPSRLVN
jgi:pilus assembly protein CpaB